MVKPGLSQTRDRLIDATLELVAERGFAGVSVGDIEVGAGLAPAVERCTSTSIRSWQCSRLDWSDTSPRSPMSRSTSPLSPLTEPASEIEAVIRWLLAELDRERTITRVIEREGDRLPELRDRMRTGVSDRGYRVVASLIERWTATITDQRIDNEALAVLLIGGLINLRRSTWSFGAPPLGLSDERFVDTFVALSTTLLNIDPNRQTA